MIRLVTGLFDTRLAILHRFTSFWASHYTWCNPQWRVTIAGVRNADPHETYIIVANHQSLVDIFVLFRLPLHYKWVSKAENFRIPFIGWNMMLNRYIRLERGTLRGHRVMMRECTAALAAGSSVLLFPEGTRSEDGMMRPFKPGAFELALQTGRPVLPVAIRGSANALPKRGIVLRGRHHIHVTVLDPVMPDQAKSASDLSDLVRSRIVAAIAAAPT